MNIKASGWTLGSPPVAFQNQREPYYANEKSHSKTAAMESNSVSVPSIYGGGAIPTFGRQYGAILTPKVSENRIALPSIYGNAELPIFGRQYSCTPVALEKSIVSKTLLEPKSKLKIKRSESDPIHSGRGSAISSDPREMGVAGSRSSRKKGSSSR